MKFEHNSPVIFSNGDLTKSLINRGILYKYGPNIVVRSTHEIAAKASYSATPNGILVINGEQGPMITSNMDSSGQIFYYVRGLPARINGRHVQKFCRDNKARWYKIDINDKKNKKKNDISYFNKPLWVNSPWLAT